MIKEWPPVNFFKNYKCHFTTISRWLQPWDLQDKKNAETVVNRFELFVENTFIENTFIRLVFASPNKKQNRTVMQTISKSGANAVRFNLNMCYSEKGAMVRAKGMLTKYYL